MTKQEWIDGVYKRGPRGRQHRLVLLGLVMKADDAGVCQLAVHEYALECRMGEKATRDALAYLQDNGWIHREQLVGEPMFAFRKVNRYTINAGKLGLVSATQ